jgi:hypothetical protein
LCSGVRKASKVMCYARGVSSQRAEPWRGRSLHHGHLEDGVADLDFVHNAHAVAGHFAKDGVLHVQVRGVFEHDVELAVEAVGVAGAGGGQRAAHISHALFDFQRHVGVFGAAGADARLVEAVFGLGITGLGDKVRHHAVEEDAVVEALAGEGEDALDVLGRDVGEEFDLHGAVRGGHLDHGVFAFWLGLWCLGGRILRGGESRQGKERAKSGEEIFCHGSNLSCGPAVSTVTLLAGFVQCGALWDNFFGGFFCGHVGAGVDPAAVGGEPAHGVAQHQLHLRLVVGGVGLVAGAEVENFAVAAFVATAGAEDFAALEPGDEDDVLRCGDGEGFAIHFFVGNFEIRAQAAGDWVAGVADPETLFFAGLAPAERAGGAHEALEDFGVVAGVQHQQAHAFEHALVHALNDAFFHLAVRAVAPPGEHVGGFEHLFCEAVVGLLQSGGGDFKIALLAQRVGDALVHAVRVDAADVFVFLFVDVFAPDGDAQFLAHEPCVAEFFVNDNAGWHDGECTGRRLSSVVALVGLGKFAVFKKFAPQRGGNDVFAGEPFIQVELFAAAGAEREGGQRQPRAAFSALRAFYEGGFLTRWRGVHGGGCQIFAESVVAF